MKFALGTALVALVVASNVSAREIRFADAPAAGGALVVPMASEAELDQINVLDASAREQLRTAIKDADFKFKRNATLSLRGVGGRTELVIVGTGDEPLDSGDLQGLGGVAAKAVKGKGPVSVIASGIRSDADVARNVAIGAALGSYSFNKYKSGAKPSQADALTVVTPAAASASNAYNGEGRALVEAVTFTRDIVTEPANVIYPETFVDRAREALAGVAGTRIEVMGMPELQRMGMGGIISVGQGSQRPPRLLIVEYKGSGAPDRPVALVGKGITFDTGGISIKPGSGMWRMKYDMSGAAAVVGTVMSLAKSRAPVNVVAIAALAENMPSGSATRPGDVIKTYNGRTIEIISTDAEGRVVLADAVAYAERRYQPSALVDIATLTGSAAQALGGEYAAMFTRDDDLAARLTASGIATDEDVWRLPLHPSYEDDTKSDIADIRNSTEGLSPGAGHGAHFIGSFLQPSTRWAHLDIAGRAWVTEDLPAVPKGAAAYGVRLLDHFVRTFSR